MVPFGVQGASSLLMRVMNQAVTLGFRLPPILGAGPLPPAGPRTGQSGGALVYMDDCLVHSPTLEQHLHDFAELLEISRRLCPKSSKCEFGRQGLGTLGRRLSAAGVSVDPRKVLSIVEWATPTSCREVRRVAGLATSYRRFLEGDALVAAPLAALGSPTARLTRTPAAQASHDALKPTLSSAPVLRPSTRPAVGRSFHSDCPP